jgi:hypothetical protein
MSILTFTLNRTPHNGGRELGSGKRLSRAVAALETVRRGWRWIHTECWISCRLRCARYCVDDGGWGDTGFVVLVEDIMRLESHRSIPVQY